MPPSRPLRVMLLEAQEGCFQQDATSSIGLVPHHEITIITVETIMMPLESRSPAVQQPLQLEAPPSANFKQPRPLPRLRPDLQATGDRYSYPSKPQGQLCDSRHESELVLVQLPVNTTRPIV